MRVKYSAVWPIDHGAIAPSARVSSGSGTTRSGSTSLRMPRPRALRAGAVGRVERERPRLEVVDGQRVAVRAGQLLGEPLLAVRVVVLAVDELQHHDAVGQVQRGLHRVGEPLLGAAP